MHFSLKKLVLDRLDTNWLISAVFFSICLAQEMSLLLVLEV